MQQAVNSVKPGLPIFMDEYNVFYDWTQSDPRLFESLGAVWYASMHRIVAEYGLSGSTNWNARDDVFGFMTTDNVLRPSAYIFKWSNSYFIGNMGNATTSSSWLEAMAVHNSAGASVYLINKGSAPVKVLVSQDVNFMGSTSLLLHKVNASGVYENLSIAVNELQTGLNLEAEAVWCLHNSN